MQDSQAHPCAQRPERSREDGGGRLREQMNEPMNSQEGPGSLCHPPSPAEAAAPSSLLSWHFPLLLPTAPRGGQCLPDVPPAADWPSGATCPLRPTPTGTLQRLYPLCSPTVSPSWPSPPSGLNGMPSALYPIQGYPDCHRPSFTFFAIALTPAHSTRIVTVIRITHSGCVVNRDLCPILSGPAHRGCSVHKDVRPVSPGPAHCGVSINSCPVNTPAEI